MSEDQKSKFAMGEKVRNTKTGQVAVVKRQRGEGLYMVSVQGIGEQEWKEADMEPSTEPKKKREHNWNRDK